MPDKAIDIIDEAVASVKLAGRQAVTVDDIETTIARMASIPPKSVAGDDDRQRLARLEDDLSSAIFGKDEAVKQLAAAVKMGRSGLLSS